MNTQVPPLALQMLLENAIKHNVISDESPLVIRIFEAGDALCVTNSFQKRTVLSEEISGIGLANHEQKIENVPNTLLLSIDHNYLKQNHLLDEHNESAYGYLFPRAELSKLIESLDAKSEKLNLKAVFLD